MTDDHETITLTKRQMNSILRAAYPLSTDDERQNTLQEALREDGPTIDLYRVSFETLMAAAEKSQWMPAEYCMNDWISDCCNFLITGTCLPEIPEGWFLYKAEHEHTRVIYRGDKHEPLPRADGCWRVEIQHRNGGRLQTANGHTLLEAWKKAVAKVMEVSR